MQPLPPFSENLVCLFYAVAAQTMPPRQIPCSMFLRRIEQGGGKINPPANAKGHASTICDRAWAKAGNALGRRRMCPSWSRKQCSEFPSNTTTPAPCADRVSWVPPLNGRQTQAKGKAGTHCGYGSRLLDRVSARGSSGQIRRAGLLGSPRHMAAVPELPPDIETV